MVHGTWKCIALNVQHVIKNIKKCTAITTGHQWQHTCGKKGLLYSWFATFT